MTAVLAVVGMALVIGWGGHRLLRSIDNYNARKGGKGCP